MSLAQFNLKEDAFPLTPSSHVDESWYGFGGLKKQYKGYLSLSEENTNRLVVLNRGRFGAGKTHAARYFTKELGRWRGNSHYSEALSFIVENPKGQKNPFSEFTVRLLNVIDSDLLVRSSRDLNASKGTDSRSFLRELIQNEDIAEALSSMTSDNRLLVRSYLLGGGTSKDLKQLKVSRKLTQANDFAAGLAGVLLLLIHGTQSPKPRRIFLWIDEMEDLIYFSSANYLPYTQALRDLLDRMSMHLSVMANFTFSEPEDLPSIKEVLGGAIMDRVNKHLVFEPPTPEEIVEYLTELLQDNLVIQGQALPLSNDAIAKLGDLCKGKTPRYVNKICANLFGRVSATPSKGKSPRPLIEEAQIDAFLPAIIQVVDEESV